MLREARALRFLAIAVGAVATHRDRGRTWRKLQLAQQLEATFAGQADVAHHQIEREALGGGDRFLHAGGDDDLVPHALENELEDFPHVGIIFYDEKAAGRSCWRFWHSSICLSLRVICKPGP